MILNRSGVWLNAFLLGAVYLLLAGFSYGVSSDSSRIALVWLPSSVAIAWILGNSHLPRLPLYLAAMLANVIMSWLYGDPLLCIVGCAIAKVTGIALAVKLLHPYYRNQLSVRDSAFIFAIYMLLVAPVSALLGATVLWLQQSVTWHQSLFNWWLGEVIGAVLLLLPALSFTSHGDRQLVTSRQLPVLGLLLLGLFCISFLVLKLMAFPFAYLTLPLMAIALVYGMLRVALLANLVFLVLGSGLAWGWWSFPVLLPAVDVRSIWTASAAVVFGPMILGLAVDEIRRRQQQLTLLGERLELASQSVDLALWDWDIKNGDIYWDDRMRQLYEIGPEEDPLTVERWRTRVHPDDITVAEGSLNDALAGLTDYKTQFRIRREDGSYRSLQAAGIVILDGAGEAVRMVGMNWDVSELVSAQKAVKSAEDKLNSVIEAASEFSIIATSREGIIEVFSAGAERLLGYTREELVGKQSPAIFHEEEEMQAEGERLTAELGYPVTGFDVFIAKANLGQVTSKEWTYVRKDGRRIPVNLTVTVIRDYAGNISGYLGVARNIIQQKIAEREIRAAHNVLEQQIQLAQQMRDEFESLFELAPGAMLVLDGRGNIVNANSRAHQLFASEVPMQGSKITDFLPLFEAWQQPGAHSANNLRHEQDWTALRTNGETLTVSLEYSPLLLNGVVHTILNVYDITAQQEAKRVLQRSKDLAESANRAKTEFLANMSHEIRTPLNAVLGAAQLLSYTTLDKNQNSHVGMISAAGQALLTLLNDVLDVSKIEAGKMELAHAPFTLSEVVEPLATIMSGNAAEKNLELVIEVDPGIPRYLVGDAMRFQQVLVNLAGNAIKFTEEGEVVVRFTLESQQDDKACIIVSVRDSGIGMDEEQKARLFSAFSQADSSITRRFGGTGLGLTICKKLVELMQGTIAVKSELGRGSEFSCRLVLAVDKKQHGAAVLPTEQRRLLIADANPASRAALQAYCHSWGWQCEVVDSVAAVRERLAANAPPIDVLIFNSNLEQADELDRRSATLPCIKLVGKVSRDDMLVAPAFASRLVVVSKPVTSSILLDSVSEAISRFSDEQPLLRPAVSVELARLDGARLLLVEDTPSNQVIIVGILEQAGARVDIAGNGAEALECLRAMQSDSATEQPYDAVLMDVQMPVMDGFTATRKIREELQLSIPIIAMTAGVLAFERQQCIDSGMNDFVGKPLDVPTMLATIAHYVPRREPGAAAVTEPPPEQVADATDVGGDEAPAPIQAGVFDPERIMQFVRGKPAREKDIIAMIRRIVEEQMQPLEEGRRLLQDQQITEAARHFHTLKGTMGNFGAEGVMQAAQALELAIKNDQVQEYEALLQRFAEALKAMLVVAEAWLAHYQSDVAAAEPEITMAAEVFAQKLDHLRDKLRDSNIEAMDLFSALAPVIRQHLGAEQFSLLSNAVEELNFEQALKTLEALSTQA